MPPILTWVLDPQTFNYERFDYRWLFLFGGKEYLTDSHLTTEFKETVIKSLERQYISTISEKFFNLIVNKT